MTTSEIALRSALLGLRTAARWLDPGTAGDRIDTATARHVLHESIANVEHELDRLALDSEAWPTDPTDPPP